MTPQQQALRRQNGSPEGPRAPFPPAPGTLAARSKGLAPSAEIFGSLVRDIMTRTVVTVRPTDTLQSAATLLAEKDISGMPVVDADGKVVGVLSEKDLLRTLRDRAGLGMPGGLFALILEPSSARQKDLLAQCLEVLRKGTVRQAMSTPAKTVTPDTLTVQAGRQMLSLGINRMPVVDHGKLVGIVTRANVLALYQGPY